IRGVLVPAFMRVAGPANWWAPAPLRRLHRRVGFTEGRAPGSSPCKPVATVGGEPFPLPADGSEFSILEVTSGDHQATDPFLGSAPA
ncbi:MAG: hypothetical protein J2O47_08755, partial [Acidimicrobiaceae bacterium]|nr:hypothetical protein [Acidimicrobiaceae bacterium]